MKIFTLLMLSLFGSMSGFSQVGDYTLCQMPPEAMKEYVKTEGVLEFPLYIGTTTIRLKRRNKAEIVHNEKKVDEQRASGTWVLEGELIQVNYEAESTTETVEYILVTYKSGVYLKSVTGNRYYKKAE